MKSRSRKKMVFEFSIYAENSSALIQIIPSIRFLTRLKQSHIFGNLGEIPCVSAAIRKYFCSIIDRLHIRFDIEGFLH